MKNYRTTWRIALWVIGLPAILAAGAAGTPGSGATAPTSTGAAASSSTGATASTSTGGTQGKGFYGTPFEMNEIPLPQFPAKVVRVPEFKADDRDAKMDYGIIQRAITACGDAGGGTVIIPSGNWVSGPLHFKSKVHLVVEKDAVVTFSDKFADYLPVVFTRWEGTECYNYSPLIYAQDCQDIAITGEGTFVGNGAAWWGWKKLQQKAADKLGEAQTLGVPVKDRIFGTEEAALRPSFVQTINCRNVLLEGFSIIDGPQWTLHPVYSENVIVRRVNVTTKGPNTDGLNPDSCQNVLVEACSFKTGDDCIAINSGMNEDGWRVNKPCENIVIRDCTMSGGHGGTVIGSGMSGGVRNVYVSNCTISNCLTGIRVKSMRGRGGFIQDIWFENINIKTVANEAVEITMFYDFTTVTPHTQTPPDFRNINLKNITATDAGTAMVVRGLEEHKIESVNLENIRLQAKNSIAGTDVDALNIRGMTITATVNKEAKFTRVDHLSRENFAAE